ncbi:MAG: 50S ribosomal protein L29 [Anaerolineales bacterium]|nr:50S ribosomal protein L29 [Anaerolineales bacterium]MCS7249082.1 50S ribosomal protein L29 [Anaerolineales bacterium]MDW8162895.1 50S ribosomal protein L29 [Anaerolineales bacterium]MDW8445935.1 50S ribosomal protein L29 [Anaerolineales bacterium]
MKPSEIRALSDAELAKKINETREALMNLRFQLAMGNLTDTAALRRTRRDLARLLTIQRERQLAKTKEASR